MNIPLLNRLTTPVEITMAIAEKSEHQGEGSKIVLAVGELGYEISIQSPQSQKTVILSNHEMQGLIYFLQSIQSENQ